jgi:hypothetical protein
MKPGIAKYWLPAIACVAISAVQAADVDISGKWVIDEAHSDEPHEVVDSAMGKNSGGPSRIRAGVSIFGIPVDEVVGLAKDGDSSPKREEEHREDVHRHVTDAIDALDIERMDGALKVDYDGIDLYLYRDDATLTDGDATLRAGWRRDAYVVERKYPDRPTVTEEFRIDRRNPDRLTWLVTTKLESGKNVRVERVYDRAE